MMRKLVVMALVALGLAACTPADEQYCNGFGVGGTAEYGKCLDYYHQQDALFSNDRALCDLEADETYPRTLYDRGRYQPVFYGGRGFGPWPGNYGYGGVSNVYVEPDYRHNAQIDQLRLRIVGPCMDAKGWNSPTSWQAGRHAAAPVKKPIKALPVAPRGNSMNALPWLN